MNQAQGSRYLTIEQAADYLQVSRWSLYKLVQRRRVPFIPVTVDSEKPILRFDSRALDAWMAKKAVVPPAAC